MSTTAKMARDIKLEVIRRESSGSVADAAMIGRVLGEQLLASGGAKILEAVYGAEADPTLRT